MAKITTIEEALKAVRKKGEALKNVPWGQLNLTVPEKAEVCLEAIWKNQHSIAYSSAVRYEDRESHVATLRNKNAQILAEIPKKMREEVRRRLESEDNNVG